MKKLLALITLLFGAISVAHTQSANDSVSFVKMDKYPSDLTQKFAIGGIILQDDYLSPLPYAGWAVNYEFEEIHLLHKWKNQWIWDNQAGIVIGSGLNPAQNASQLHLMLYTSTGVLRKFCITQKLNTYVGPNLSIGIGGIYSSRNGNNPATLKFPIHLNIQSKWIYHLPLERFPIRMRADIQYALIGTAFSQPYGASYYEQFYLDHSVLGGLKNGMNFIHPFNYQDIKTELLIDIPIKHYLTLTLGYHFHYMLSQMNHLQTKISQNYFVIGFTKSILNKRGTYNTKTY